MDQYKTKFNVFHDFMNFRVREILLVSSLYDAFVLEEEGRLSEKIFSEYVDLNLRYIPRITRVSTATEAFEALQKRTYNMVITMTRIADMNPIVFGREVKKRKPGMPVILLSYEWIDWDILRQIRITGCIDKVFYWSGDTKILLAIIKFVEDLKNVAHDIGLGARVILIVEDSPKFYSLFLPIVYAEIMTQTRRLVSEGVNDLHRLLRVRARPKILMAETFEQGIEIYEKYNDHLLGIISDVRFPHGENVDNEAGFIFARKVRENFSDIPIILQSSDLENRERAHREQLGFLHKDSNNLLEELSIYILSDFGFGDFIFKLPDGREYSRAKNLIEFAKTIQSVPDDCFEYHMTRNHFSMWLRARTEFELAEQLRKKGIADFDNLDTARQHLVQEIQKLIYKNRFGVITDFERSQFDSESSFIRLGNGSLGGKARSIAFLNALLTKLRAKERFSKVNILTPNTFVLCTEVFEEFIKNNNLLSFAIHETCNEKIAYRFVKAKLPGKIVKDLKTLLENIDYPLAVRSSSIFEDSHMLPFAGLYSTYMLPNNHYRFKTRLNQLCDAIRLVFASVFYKNPKEYVKNSYVRTDEEKMAVIIQQIVGKRYENYYYPTVSGVAQSYNFYPISYMKPEEGIVHLALGLGAVIVEGKQNIFRFSPRFPEMNPPYASPAEFLKESQRCFYAVDLSDPDRAITEDDKNSLERLDLSVAENHESLFFTASTFSAADNAIRDTIAINGPRVLTFANVLKYRLFPMAEILNELLEVLRHAFGSHVEIEFAVNLNKGKEKKPEFYLLQARPMVVGEENIEISIKDIKKENIMVKSVRAMGNGVFKELHDLVYVDPGTFDLSKTQQIAREVGQINQRMCEEDKKYILMGFGRWGTTNRWLGIPVEWRQISKAKLIVEANWGDKFNVDPSQGTHFFHNMVSLGLGYFHIRKNSEEEFLDWDWIKKQEIIYSTEYVRHVRLSKPMVVKIDGRISQGVICFPEAPPTFENSSPDLSIVDF